MLVRIVYSITSHYAIVYGVPDPDDEETGYGEEFVRRELQMEAAR